MRGGCGLRRVARAKFIEDEHAPVELSGQARTYVYYLLGGATGGLPASVITVRPEHWLTSSQWHPAVAG